MARLGQRDELRRISMRINKVTTQVWQTHFGPFSPAESWSPAINLYRLATALEVCVDLAGVDARSIEVRVEPGRLTLRGARVAPEPHRQHGQAMRILAMEIDHGPFCRTVPLPDQVDPGRMASEYRNGLLWLRLPFRGHS